MKIEFAEKSDIGKILDIFNKLSLTKKHFISKKDLSKGFLVYPVDKNILEDAIKSKEIFLVVRERKEILGYLLAYDFLRWIKNNSSWKNKIKLKRRFRDIFDNKLIYFKHIGKISSKKGIGLNLEEKLFSIAKDKNYDFILAEIAIKPRNRLSIKIHKKRGFKKIGEIDYEDGIKWGLYSKEIK